MNRGPIRPKINMEKVISKLSDHILFYIFYYEQNTFKQRLAAEELSDRGW